MSAPIKHTCPDIDKALKHIKNAWSEIKDSVEDRKTKDSIEWELDMVGDILEELRSSNDTLRSWGCDLEKTITELEDQVYDFECQLKEKE